MHRRKNYYDQHMPEITPYSYTQYINGNKSQLLTKCIESKRSVTFLLSRLLSDEGYIVIKTEYRLI